MAKFFNPKEDVMDIQITSLGKHLLSKGAFVPEFYAFFDDDVIYDLQYVSGSIGEHQNKIETRIQDETPRLKTRSALSGVETNIKRSVEMVKQKVAEIGSKTLQPLSDKHFALPMPLGTSALNSTHSPAWDAYFIKGKLSGSTSYFSSEASPHIKIPQLECELIHRAKPFAPSAKIPADLSGTKLKNKINASDDFVQHNSDADTVGVFGGVFDDFEDGSKLKVYKDSIIIELSEENTDYLSENFDIEVYEISAVTGSSQPNSNKKNEYEELIPLYFARQQFNDMGVSYLSDETSDLDENFPDVDSNYVEHYFEINVDREIDPFELCAHLPNEKARRKSIAKEFDCPDNFTGRTYVGIASGMYDSNIDDPPEDCD